MDLSDRQGFCPPDCPGFRALNVRRCSGTGRLMIPMTSLRRYVCHPVTLSQDTPYRGQSQYQARLIPLMRSKRCAVCTCSMYLQYVLAVCTCSMYLQTQCATGYPVPEPDIGSGSGQSGQYFPIRFRFRFRPNFGRIGRILKNNSKVFQNAKNVAILVFWC